MNMKSLKNNPVISNERVEALEDLLRDNSMPKNSYDSSPGVYVRSDKDRELDVLWQGFKVNSKEERSPGVYLFIGFITGALCMFLMSAILNFGGASNNALAGFSLFGSGDTTIETQVLANEEKQLKPKVKMEKYEIQPGDSLEKIAVIYYGYSNLEKINEIQEANNLTNPNQIRAGDKLLIPIKTN